MDYREKLTKDLEVLFQSLINVQADSFMVSNQIVKTLADYEITGRCTEVVPVDDMNNKLLKRYSACLRIDGKSEKTIYQYIRACNKLSEVITKPFTEMDTYDIRYFLAMEKERGISNISLENTRSFLSTFFQWLTDEEVIPKNPISKITTIKCHQEIKRPFTDVEIDALRSACRTEKERGIIELLLSSGIRVSELTNMKTSDIDFQTLTVHVVNGKGDKERITYTTPVCVSHLRAYISEKVGGDNEYLFYNNNHRPLKEGGVRYILKELGKRAGVNDCHPHRFRRWFGCELAKRGMPVQDIQELMGHENIETTMIYVSNDNQKVQASYRRYIV